MRVHLEAFVLVAIACFSGATAVFWDDLRCTFGLDLTKSFLQLPRTAKEAAVAGYAPEGGTTEENCKGGPFRCIRWVHETDPSLVMLFDTNGIICGLQAQIRKSDVDKPCNPYKFDEVLFFQPFISKGEDYYVLTMYFVDPESICNNGRTLKDLMNQGTGVGLWYQNGPGKFIEVPKSRPTALSQGWSDNQCFPGMGKHCLWQTDKYEDHHCTKIQPTIVLYDPDTDTMHGAGFTIVGPCTTSCGRCEDPPADVVNKIYNPTPQCLKDVSANCGGCTMHCYFIKKPWDIKCP